jgi:predicted dehydrogenase
LTLAFDYPARSKKKLNVNSFYYFPRDFMVEEINLFNPIKLGIIGAGVHAHRMLVPCLKYVDELKLVAMAASRPETAKRAEALQDVKCHVGYERLLADENVDAVIIAVSTSLHEKIGIEALEAGKHVIIESGYPKLLDSNIVEKLRSLQKQTGKVLMFGNCELYMPIYVKFKEIFDNLKQKSGPDEPMNVSARYYWWPQLGSEGTGIHHFLNLLLWFNGSVKRVWGTGRNRQIQGMLEYANQDLGTFLGMEYNIPYIPMERVEALGKDCSIIAINGYELRYCENIPGLEAIPEKEGRWMRFDHANEVVWDPSFSLTYNTNTSLYFRGYIPELEDFVDCIKTGKTPRAHLDQITACQQLTKALNDSVKRDGESIIL